MIKYTYWKWDAVLSREQCDLIIESTDWSAIKEAQIGDYELKTSVRKTDVVWSPNLSVIGCVCNSYAIAANRLAGWDFELIYNEQVQMSKYKDDGDFYDWHIDVAPPVNETQRKLSVSILLNDNFEGGEFDFDLEKDVLKKVGSVLVFPSFVRHRVRPVTKGTRYTAVNWIVGDKFR